LQRKNNQVFTELRVTEKQFIAQLREQLPPDDYFNYFKELE
jgi:hypothetical protein